MRKICLLLCLLLVAFDTYSQQYPPEWVKYTYGDYLYDIQTDFNSKDLSETDFKNYLLNIARANIAKQIQVQVQDKASLNKQSVNGQTSIEYSAKTRFSTNVNLRLVETRTIYDKPSKLGYAIACINRHDAFNFYKNEITLLYNKIGKSMTMAENYIASGFKIKARNELEAALKFFASVDDALMWMSIFGASQTDLTEMQHLFNTSEQKIKQKIADLKHGVVIYMVCDANIFGKKYTTLQNELKGILSTDGCSFTETPQNADWVIKIKCSCREYSNVNIGTSKSYFSYVDAAITIDKTISSQRIYENGVSVKGGHSFGYYEAAKTGYKELKLKLGETIKKIIEQ